MNQSKPGVSRRDFVRSGALATASLTAFTIMKSKDARAVQPIKIGVIGCGGRGKAAMEDALKSSEGVQITHVADLFPDKVDSTKERLANFNNEIKDENCFVGFDAWKNIVAADVDYVILATPPVFRPMTLEACVDAKKNVFMEKPAAIDAPGIRRIIAAGKKANESNLKIAAGTQRRHQGDYIETIKRIQDGAIGDITFTRAFWCNAGPIGFGEKRPGMTDFEWQMRSWYHFLWLSGDHIVEQHVHNLDVINWIMGGHPIKAYGQGGRAWQERGNIWDHHSVEFQYPNGVYLLSMCNQYPRPDNAGRVWEYVQGTKGESNCRDWIKTKDGKEWKYEGEYVGPYIQEHADLITAIREDKPLNEAENVATSTMTAILGRTAEYTGGEVTWDEAINSNEDLGLKEYALGPVDLAPVPIPGGIPYSEDMGWNPDPKK